MTKNKKEAKVSPNLEVSYLCPGLLGEELLFLLPLHLHPTRRWIPPKVRTGHLAIGGTR